MKWNAEATTSVARSVPMETPHGCRWRLAALVAGVHKASHQSCVPAPVATTRRYQYEMRAAGHAFKFILSTTAHEREMPTAVSLIP